MTDSKGVCTSLEMGGVFLKETISMAIYTLAGIQIRYVHTVKFNMYIKTYLCAVRMIPTYIHMYYYEMKYVHMYRIVICVQLYSMYCRDV